MKVKLQEAPETHASFFKDQGIENNSIINDEEELDYEPVEIAEDDEVDIYGLCPDDFEYYSDYAKEYIRKRYDEDFFEVYGNDPDIFSSLMWDNMVGYWYEYMDGLKCLTTMKYETVKKYAGDYDVDDLPLWKLVNIGYIGAFDDNKDGLCWFDLELDNCENARELEYYVSYLDKHFKK